MVADETETIIITQARAGDEQALLRVRGWLGPQEPASHYRRILEVAPSGLLCELSAAAPKTRREVYPSFVPFETWPNYPPTPGSSREAIASIQGSGPLEEHFLRLALTRMGELEARLIMDDSLSAAGRTRLRQQLKELGASGRSFWENWIWQTPEPARRQFDAITYAWLGQPPDCSLEVDWFRPNVMTERAIASAKVFCKSLPSQVLSYFEITSAQATIGERTIDCCVMSASLAESKRRAKLLQVKFQFQSVK